MTPENVFREQLAQLISAARQHGVKRKRIELILCEEISNETIGIVLDRELKLIEESHD